MDETKGMVTPVRFGIGRELGLVVGINFTEFDESIALSTLPRLKEEALLWIVDVCRGHATQTPGQMLPGPKTQPTPSMPR
jgi:hypothetical protein